MPTQYFIRMAPLKMAQADRFGQKLESIREHKQRIRPADFGIRVYWASSCLKTWCRRSESNWHKVTPIGFLFWGHS